MNWHNPVVQVLGDFDPLKLGWIRQLTLTCKDDGHGSWCLDVDVDAAYGSRHFIAFRISNARKLRMAEINPSFFGFGELFIESLQGRGMEMVNYELHDELAGFSC